MLLISFCTWSGNMGVILPSSLLGELGNWSSNESAGYGSWTFSIVLEVVRLPSFSAIGGGSTTLPIHPTTPLAINGGSITHFCRLFFFFFFFLYLVFFFLYIYIYIYIYDIFIRQDSCQILIEDDVALILVRILHSKSTYEVICYLCLPYGV
jgi:hypothetical protein